MNAFYIWAMHENLLKIVRHQVEITDHDIQLCIENFGPLLFPRNRIIEKEGKIPQVL
jgi:hypothetical protein